MRPYRRALLLGAAAFCACSHAEPAPTKAANPSAPAAPATVPPSAAAAGVPTAQPPSAAAAGATAAQPASAAPAGDRSWIARSNENAKILLAVQARFAPEQAARVGQAGLDDRITDLSPGHEERLRQAVREAQAKIEQLRQGERDPLAAQD